MKILHTSDWHLGRSLYGWKRYDEFRDFLDWMVTVIEERKVDILLVAGDIFDTVMPTNRSQELYYGFLCRVAGSYCRNIVVTGGNHDSASFLSAPKELLRALNVHVVGSVTENLEDEVIVLYGDQAVPEAIVCAVPYLRDKDVRAVEPGETIDDKNRKLVLGVKEHYAAVVSIAEEKREGLDLAFKVPIVAMGHLFAAGGRTLEGDGVRELYVGSLAHVGKDVFPLSIDYLALGHLHVPQRVGGEDHMRYSGSPLPMGYGESKQAKKVILVEFEKGAPVIEEIPVPCFQSLERVAGSLEDIIAKIDILKQEGSQAWLEIEYTGDDIVPGLQEICEGVLAGSDMELRRTKRRTSIDLGMSAAHEGEDLSDLDVEEVFIRRLDLGEVAAEVRAELMVSYNEIRQSLHEYDINAE